MKIHRTLVDRAAHAFLDKHIQYNRDLRDVKKFCNAAGISKGQWKRFMCSLCGPYSEAHMTASTVVFRKLQTIVSHRDSPHLPTLLRMIDAQENSDEHQ